MLEIELINPTHTHWNKCTLFYMEAFPPDERREPDELVDIQGTKGYNYSVVLDDGEFAGFIETWEFEDFVFIEHLALIQAKRNQGIGSFLLNQVITNTSKIVLLEAEHPTDELSERRIQFYLRLGFKQVDIDYNQPPYYPGKSSVPMILFSNKPLQVSLALNFIQSIRLNVYKTP